MTDPLMTDTITIYNRYPYKNGPIIKVRYDRTVLRSVMWKESANRNQSSDGKSFLDSTISVTIPVEADSGEKSYIDSGRFAKLPVDDTGHWTMTIDTVNPDIIVYGDCPAVMDELYTIAQLEKDYSTMQIRAVADNTNVNPVMGPYWEVMGV